MSDKGLATISRSSKAVACALFLIGAAVSIGAFSYEVGALRRMGPGYFPLLLGIALCLLSGLVLFEDRGSRDQSAYVSSHVWLRHGRALLFPLGGILLFAALIKAAGFLPAVFACTLLAGFADRTNRPVPLVLIAVVVAIFAATVFVFGLGIPVRLFAL